MSTFDRPAVADAPNHAAHRSGEGSGPAGLALLVPASGRRGRGAPPKTAAPAETELRAGKHMNRSRMRTATSAVFVAVFAGVGAVLLSALSPAAGSEVTDAEYGQEATHCIRFETRKEAISRTYMRNTCAKRITVFWCEPKGSSRVTKCGVGGNWPGGDSVGIDNPLHNQNKYYAQGVPIPASEERLLSADKEMRYGACFGGRFMAEWFSSDRNGNYRCHPKAARHRAVAGERSGAPCARVIEQSRVQSWAR